MKNLNFIAIDIETANRQQHICQIGLVKIVDSIIAEEHIWYIRPPENKYDFYQKKIHHIDPALTENAPDFKTIWPIIRPYLHNQIVVAHSAKSAELSILTKEFDRNNIEKPTFSCICTYQFAEHLANAPQSYKLPDLCAKYDIECIKHHDALNDATATAFLFLKLFNEGAYSSIDDISQRIEYNSDYKIKAFRTPKETPTSDTPVGRILHFIRRKALDIEGLGEETVELLHDNGLLRTAADLYDLRAEQLAPLPRLGEKSAENIIRSIERSKRVPFHRVLFGLGIRFVGETTARYLADHFRTLDRLRTAAREELVEADEVGGKIADAILDYFARAENLDQIERLRRAGLQFEAVAEERASDALEGRSFVVSGRFSISRDELKHLIEAHGGRNVSAVSGQVDYLVAGEKMGPEKRRKAEKLGVRILTEEEFMQLLAGAPEPGGGQTASTEERPETETKAGSAAAKAADAAANDTTAVETAETAAEAAVETAAEAAEDTATEKAAAETARTAAAAEMPAGGAPHDETNEEPNEEPPLQGSLF